MVEQKIPAMVNRPAEQTDIVTDKVIEQKRLETLLFENSSTPEKVEHTVHQRVGHVSDGKIKRRGLLLILLIFCILLLGVGYYYLSHVIIPQSPQPQLSRYVSPMISIPVRPVENVSAADMSPPQEIPLIKTEQESAPVTPFVDDTIPLFTVTVGPFINTAELHQAIGLLQELGMQPQEKAGRGLVTMIRLLEGVYPAAAARIRLAELKKIVDSAFLLPVGDQLGVYMGSFHQEDRAQKMRDDLAEKMIDVLFVDSEVMMSGTLLIALQADQQTANEVVTHISSLGLHTQVQEKK